MKRSLILGACLMSLSLSALAEDEFMVSISSSTPMAQGAGLVLAGQALEQKARCAFCCAVPPATLRSTVRSFPR